LTPPKRHSSPQPPSGGFFMPGGFSRIPDFPNSRRKQKNFFECVTFRQTYFVTKVMFVFRDVTFRIPDFPNSRSRFGHNGRFFGLFQPPLPPPLKASDEVTFL
jgi:hypothetical protein